MPKVHRYENQACPVDCKNIAEDRQHYLKQENKEHSVIEVVEKLNDVITEQDGKCPPDDVNQDEHCDQEDDQELSCPVLAALSFLKFELVNLKNRQR